ncbi:hypothetical protein PINS_up015333 [Pythium insidiosum]|nr:hypothetical protein PINS_up015333 [Pythium insidiosum]
MLMMMSESAPANALAVGWSAADQEILLSLLQPSAASYSAEMMNEPYLSDSESESDGVNSASHLGKRSLDPLPLEMVEGRTEYFTVSDYAFPVPEKRQRRRMTQEQRRQRHREVQREFMKRKKARISVLQAEINELELQHRWLQASKERRELEAERRQLQVQVQTGHLNLTVAINDETSAE